MKRKEKKRKEKFGEEGYCSQEMHALLIAGIRSSGAHRLSM